MFFPSSDILGCVADDKAPALVAPLDGDDTGLLESHELGHRLRLRGGEIRPNIAISVSRVQYL